MPDRPGEFTFIYFDQSHRGAHNSRTRQTVRSAAAKTSHSWGKRQYSRVNKEDIGTNSSQANELPLDLRTAGKVPKISGYQAVRGNDVLPISDANEGSGAWPYADQQDPVHSKWQRCTHLKQRSASTVQCDHCQDLSIDGSESLAVVFDESTKLTPQPDPTNPFDCWSVPMQPFYPRLIQYLWPFMIRGWTAMDTTPMEQSQALTWVQHITFSEPAYFYKNMHSVAGDLLQRNMIDSRIYHWLQAQCIASIHDAVADEQRRCSPGVILAVGRIALKEVILGDSKVGQDIHRPAMVRMVALAGGLDALQLPKLVKEHLLWGERLMARQTGVAMLQEAYVEEPPDDIGVLNAYMPYRNRSNGRI